MSRWAYESDDDPKMLRETLCLAQSAIAHHSDSSRRREHIDRLQRLIDECDQYISDVPDRQYVPDPPAKEE